MSLVEHLEKLRYFHKLSKFRSINEGSQAMGISQAGLSKSLASLEDVLGTQLFTRSNEGLVLTKEGDLVLRTTETILEAANSLETRLRSLKASEVPEKIRIGMYDSIAIYFFPSLSKYMKLIYPHLDMELVVDRSKHLNDWVNSGELDIAVGVNLRELKGRSECFLLFEDHYSYYVAPEMKGDLSKLPFIIHPVSTDGKNGSLAEQMAPVIRKRLVHEVFNFETLKTLTAQGMGIGVLPTQVARPLVEQKQLVGVKIPRAPSLFGKHSIGFLTATPFLNGHREFAHDILRLGHGWAGN